MLDLNKNPKDIQDGTLNALIMIHNECEAAGAREAMYQLADLIDQVACRHLVVTMPAGPRVPPTESKPGGRARMLILTEAQVNALGRALDYAHDDQEHASKADYTPEDMAGLATTYRDIGSVGEMLFNGELERWNGLANVVLGENTCRICGKQYKEGGDGFDGCCPGCAEEPNAMTQYNLHTEAGDKLNGTSREAMLEAVRAQLGADCDFGVTEGTILAGEELVATFAEQA